MKRISINPIFMPFIFTMAFIFTMSPAFGEETKQAEVKVHEEAQAPSGTIPLGV